MCSKSKEGDFGVEEIDFLLFPGFLSWEHASQFREDLNKISTFNQLYLYVSQTFLVFAFYTDQQGVYVLTESLFPCSHYPDADLMPFYGDVSVPIYWDHDPKAILLYLTLETWWRGHVVISAASMGHMLMLQAIFYR